MVPDVDQCVFMTDSGRTTKLPDRWCMTSYKASDYNRLGFHKKTSVPVGSVHLFGVRSMPLPPAPPVQTPAVKSALPSVKGRAVNSALAVKSALPSVNGRAVKSALPSVKARAVKSALPVKSVLPPVQRCAVRSAFPSGGVKKVVLWIWTDRNRCPRKRLLNREGDVPTH